jgi:hypothetical protein
VALAIYDLYSKRQKKLRGEVPDVYTYDEIPEPLRVQILHIWQDTLGVEGSDQDRYSSYQIMSTYKEQNDNNRTTEEDQREGST